MLSLRSAAAPLLLVGLAAGSAGTDAMAATIRETSAVVIVREGESAAEDLFAIAETVRIDGTVDGDLIALADRVEVNGVVRGDLVGVARESSVSGTVEGSIRLGAGSLAVTGSVGDDILSAVTTLVIEGQVGRDVMVWGNTVRHRGSIGRDLDVRLLGSVSISGSVDRNVDVIAGSLAVDSTAEVGGALVYRSNIDAEISDQATVGRVVVREPATTPVQLRAARLLILVLLAIGFVLLGVGTFWAFPRSVRNATLAITRRPVRTLLTGIGVVAVPAALAAVAAIGLAVGPIAVAAPALALLIPAFVASAILLALVAVIAPIPVLTAIGRNLGSDRSPLAAFALTAPVFLILVLVPYVGTVVVGVVVLFGLGAWTLGWLRSRGDTGWAFGHRHGRGRHRARRRESEIADPND